MGIRVPYGQAFSRRLSAWAAVLLSLLVVSACGAEPADDAFSPVPHTAALLDVTRSEEAPRTRWTVRAIFPRYAGVSSDRLALALDHDAATLLERPPGCRLADPSQPPSPPPEDEAFVELLEAGDLRLTLDGRTLRLPARNWPPLEEVLGGALYAADLAGVDPTVRHLQLEASGEEAPPLSVLVEPPAAPVLRRAVQTPSGHWVLRWAPPPEDTVLLVHVEGGTHGPLHCKVPASGELSFPYDGRAFPRLSARAVRLRSVEAPGYDEAWLLASTRIEVALPR